MEGKDLIVSLITVWTILNALKAMENAADITPVKEGVTLIQHKLKNILTQKGLKEWSR